MTEKQFMSYLKKVKREVRRLGADLVPIDSVKFVNRANPMGLCLYYDGSYPYCSLEFADVLLQLDEVSIHETIAHELLHCIRDSVGHGPLFKKYAALVNEKYGLDIDTYTSLHIVNDTMRHRIFNYVVRCTKCGNRIGYVLLDIRLFFHYYMDSETNGKPSTGASDPHKTVEVFQKNRKLWQAAWGNGLKPAEFPDSKHAFVGKTPNEKKSREVFQNPILRPVEARLPSHIV